MLVATDNTITLEISVLVKFRVGLGHDIIAVSYTHLDVYKRQLLPFRPIFKSVSSIGINFAYTYLGTKKNNLIAVNNFNIGISIHLKEGFYERKKYE